MKVYDPDGDYTPEEVVKALSGDGSSRKIFTRYERLDRSNNKIEDIDYVASCTVEYQELADIKRTAKVEMYDEANFNFQQDRLKAYVGIEMPEDRNYNNKISSLYPVLHYPLNEPAVTVQDRYYAYPDFDDTTTNDHETRETAYSLDLRPQGAETYHTYLDTNRLVSWSKFTNNMRKPIHFHFNDRNTGVDNTSINYKVWFAADDTSDLSLVLSGNVPITNQNHMDFIESPDMGTYYIEASMGHDPLITGSGVSYHVTISRPTVLQDISESGVTAYSVDYNFGGRQLINNRALDAAEGDTVIPLTHYTFRSPTGTFSGSSMPYPQNLDVRNPVTTFGFNANTTYYHEQHTIPAQAGDRYYVEFIAKHYKVGLDKLPENIRVGIQPLTSTDAVIPGWDATSINGDMHKIEELENGWARYAGTPFIPANLTTTAKARLSVYVQQKYSSGWEPQEWAIENKSWKWVKRASSYTSPLSPDEKSLKIGLYETQKWFTLDNQQIPMDNGMTVNFWQRLYNGSDAFTFSSKFYSVTGYVELSCSRLKGANAVYTVKVVNDTDYNAYTFEAKLTVDKKYIDVNTNFYSIQIDMPNRKISLYKNATLLGRFTTQASSAPIDSIEQFFNPITTITKAEIQFENGSGNPDAVLLIDDYTVFTRPIAPYDLLEIAERGFKDVTPRKGYVEWPQGVFLLSAPNRVMNDGNTVTRSVDAYDQLLVLKEDSELERFAAMQGEKYTDVIDKVLQSTVAPQHIDAESVIWKMTSNVIRETADTVSFPAGTTVAAPGRFQTEMDKIVLRGSSISAKMPSTVSQWQIGYFRKNDQYLDAYWRREGTMLTPDGYGSQFVAATTYDPVKFAYLRVREDTTEQRIYYEYSSDGQTWNWWGRFDYPAFVANGNPLSGNSTTMIGINMVGAGIATKIRVAGTIASERFIVDKPDTLPSTREWEPGTSKLTIINDLLGAINYGSATFDEDGRFVAKPYVSPSLRASEYTYATNQFSVISGDVKQEIDLTGVPNAWVLVVSQPDKAPMVSKYENNNPNSITSTVARGRRIVDVRNETEVSSQAVLDAKVIRLANEASQIYEHIEFETALMPIHSSADVYMLEIDGLVIHDKFSETSWSMALEAGAVMKHKARRSVSL